MTKRAHNIPIQTVSTSSEQLTSATPQDPFNTYRVMADFSANDLSHVGNVHGNGFSPVCTRMCLPHCNKRLVLLELVHVARGLCSDLMSAHLESKLLPQSGRSHMWRFCCHFSLEDADENAGDAGSGPSLTSSIMSAAPMSIPRVVFTGGGSGCTAAIARSSMSVGMYVPVMAKCCCCCWALIAKKLNTGTGRPTMQEALPQ
jgi:hypothetical protein